VGLSRDILVCNTQSVMIGCLMIGCLMIGFLFPNASAVVKEF
jgi:hypothetical protein